MIRSEATRLVHRLGRVDIKSFSHVFYLLRGVLRKVLRIYALIVEATTLHSEAVVLVRNSTRFEVVLFVVGVVHLQVLGSGRDHLPVVVLLAHPDVTVIDGAFGRMLGIRVETSLLLSTIMCIIDFSSW